MNTVTADLSSLPAFSHLSRAAVGAMNGLCSVRSLDKGQHLWWQNELSRGVALLLAGELEASVDGLEVGRIGAKEIVGEVAGFSGNSRRCATVRALEPSKMLMISGSALRELRRQGAEVYDALYDNALQTLARRVRTTDLKMAQIAQGTMAAPVRRNPTLFDRLAGLFRREHHPGEPPPIASLLRELPGVYKASREVVEELRGAFEVLPVAAGEIICLEGERGSNAYFVAEGRIEVVRRVRGRQAVLIAKLETPDLFGANTMVDGGTRTASCIAATNGWLFRISAAAANKLSLEPRRIWNNAMLTSLTAQLRNANATFHETKSGKAGMGKGRAGERRKQRGSSSPIGGSFNELLRASGYRNGSELESASLDRIRVIETEDQKRNPRRRTL